MANRTALVQEEQEKELLSLKNLVLNLTDGEFRTAEEIQLQTGHSIGKCHEMLRHIDKLRTEAMRGQL
jgi:hypothetical protein